MENVSISLSSNEKNFLIKVDDKKQHIAINAGYNYTEILIFQDFDKTNTYLQSLYKIFSSIRNLTAIEIRSLEDNATLLKRDLHEKKSFFSHANVPAEVFNEREYVIINIIESEDYYHGKH